MTDRMGMDRTTPSIARAGFTLFEVLVYIGIIGFVTLPAIGFAWVLVGDHVKQDRIAEVDAVGTFSLHRISREVRNAQQIEEGSVFGAHPGALHLITTGGIVTLDTEARTVPFGTQAASIRKLRVRTGGGAAEDLTSDAVDVTRFVFTDRSSGGRSAVEVELELVAVNPGGDVRYAAQRRWTTTIALRR